MLPTATGREKDEIAEMNHREEIKVFKKKL